MSDVSKATKLKGLSARERRVADAAVERERAAVVRWLREHDNDILEALASGTWWIDDVLNAAAAAIEAGEHLKEAK